MTPRSVQLPAPLLETSLDQDVRTVLLTDDPLVLSAFAHGGLSQWLAEFPCPEGYRLLEEWQCLFLWQAILQEYQTRYPITDPQGTARAAHAYHKELILGRHGRGRAAKDAPLTVWHKAFKSRTREAGLEDRTTRLQRLAQGRLDLTLVAGRRLALVGLDSPAPLWQDVMARLEEAGGRVQWHQRAVPDTDTGDVFLQATSEEEAVEAAAAWCRERLQHGCPAVQIATFGMGAASRWRQSLIGLEFALEGEPGGFPDPMVTNALDVAALDAAHPEFSVWSRVLRSPFVGDYETEAFSRCVVETLLREAGHHRPPLSRVQSLCRQERTHSLLPLMFGLLQKSRGDRTRCSVWSQRFSELLDLASWPGDHAERDQHELDQIKLVRESLSDLRTLDRVVGNLDHTTALGYWSQCLSRRKRTRPHLEVKVQLHRRSSALWFGYPDTLVMGPARTTGPSFSHLLPAASRRRLEAQRKSEQERLGRWPRLELQAVDGLEAEAGLSTSDVPLISQARLDLVGAAELEVWQDRAPAVSREEKVRGGASLLSLQARCPYRAFANLRLRARSLESVSFGLDARTRGEFVHTCCEHLWNELGDQKALLGLDAESRERLVDRIVSKVVSDAVPDYPEELDARGFELERRRLLRLLLAVLRLEEQRPPFAVEAVEKEVTFALEEASLKLRIDRIDRQEDGSLLLIDYKTGRPNLAQWFGERPESPQLPLYLLALGEEVQGLAYLRARPNEEAFLGMGSEPFDRLRLKEGAAWRQAAEEWAEVLSQLMREYLAGQAQVDPRSYPSTCRHCGLQSLCRVSELKR